MLALTFFGFLLYGTYLMIKHSGDTDFKSLSFMELFGGVLTTLPTICLGLWCLLNKIEEKDKKK